MRSRMAPGSDFVGLALLVPSRNVTFNAKSKLNNETLVFNALIINQTSCNLDVATGKTITAAGWSSRVYFAKRTPLPRSRCRRGSEPLPG